jgi:hypothetical protein
MKIAMIRRLEDMGFFNEVPPLVLQMLSLP